MIYIYIYLLNDSFNRIFHKFPYHIDNVHNSKQTLSYRSIYISRYALKLDIFDPIYRNIFKNIWFYIRNKYKLILKY